MVIYNVTMKVDWAIAKEWLQWMQDTHIPEILATGYYIKHQFVRLLEIDETDGPTYAVQYYCASLNEYNEYLKKYALSFSKLLKQKWGDKSLAFGTLMEVINPVA